jgi:HTH-type transcriptional regulator/antitoxin HigA
MTLRHDRLDNFWFTLLHELAHLRLHLHGSNLAFFDDTEKGHHDARNMKENDADALARDSMIPPDDWKDVYSQLAINVTKNRVISIADQLDISPAIVAGRLRWEKNDYTLVTQLVGHKQVRTWFL